MNLVWYISRQVGEAVNSWVQPDRVNCWLRCQTHDWGAGDHGWATKACQRCGQIVHGCGL